MVCLQSPNDSADYQGLQGEMTVGFENTITENDLDPASQQFVQGLRTSDRDLAPDLDVDGLSDSIVARLKRFLSFGRA
jgi:hypothetical protein